MKKIFLQCLDRREQDSLRQMNGIQYLYSNSSMWENADYLRIQELGLENYLNHVIARGAALSSAGIVCVSRALRCADGLSEPLRIKVSPPRDAQFRLTAVLADRVQRAESAAQPAGVLPGAAGAGRGDFEGVPLDHREGRPAHPGLPEQPAQNALPAERAAGVREAQPGDRVPAGLQLHRGVLLAPGVRRGDRVLAVLPPQREPGAGALLPRPVAAFRGRENVQVLFVLQGQASLPGAHGEPGRPVLPGAQVVPGAFPQRRQPPGTPRRGRLRCRSIFAGPRQQCQLDRPAFLHESYA